MKFTYSALRLSFSESTIDSMEFVRNFSCSLGSFYVGMGMSPFKTTEGMFAMLLDLLLTTEASCLSLADIEICSALSTFTG